MRARTVGDCRALPILARWERSGLTRASSNGVALAFKADLHDQDCGAPDCYGTEIDLDLTLTSRDGGCFIDRVQVRTRDYVHCGHGQDEEGRPTSAAFSVDEAPDLASGALQRITFRSADGRSALVIRPAGAFWFASVERDGVLHEAPAPGDGHTAGCCWAAVMSASQFSQP